MPTPREIALTENAAGTFAGSGKADQLVQEQGKPRERDYCSYPTNPPDPPAPCRVTRG